MASYTERRKFLATLGGAAVSWPLAARAQQAERARRVGVLIPLAPDDPVVEARKPVFEQSLRQLGWTVGANLSIEYRLAGGDAESIRGHAAELVALAPDVIVTSGGVTPAPLLQATRTIPIVMVNVPDPVGTGWVQSLARPGGNATGFTNFEYSLGGKWVEFLKQIAPGIARAAVLRGTTVAGIGQFAAVQSGAHLLGVELVPVGVHDTTEMERGVAAFARSGNGGLIVTAAGTASRRNLIIALASRFKLPAIYPYRCYAIDGGLMTYGPDTLDLFRRAAGYVDRILLADVVRRLARGTVRLRLRRLWAIAGAANPQRAAPGSIPSPIPHGSIPWVRACRASLALLPQLPRPHESSIGARVHREPAQASPVLSPGFDSSIGHPLQLVEPFSKIRRLQCLDVGFYQLAKLASLSRGEIADRNCLQKCRCCVGCVRGA
jgi:putative tryptophan/tyrosine transport system substrate-binding protein